MAASPVSPLSNLQVETQRTTEHVIVICHGRIEADTIDLLQDEVRKALPDTKRVVIDLGDVSYLDSSGLGGLVSLYASARRKGTELKLAHPSARIADLLRITHLASLFE
jgi:anti-sigma B factor antagonist